MSRPQALVYRGPATCKGCPEAVANLLEFSPRHFEVHYAGPEEEIQINLENLQNVELYAQPGGDDGTICRHNSFQSYLQADNARLTDLDEAYEQLKQYRPAIRVFVKNGGRYLGICLGAYLAGWTPGFGLLPKKSDADQEIKRKRTQVKNEDDTVIQVDWTWSAGSQAGRTTTNRWMYFQDGTVIVGFRSSANSFVLGRYSKTGDVAASLNQYGEGWVGLIGPHPEASQEWCKRCSLNSEYLMELC